MLLARAATLLVLLDALMAVLIIDFACFFLDENFVSLGYLNEFLVRLVVATLMC